MKIAIVFAVFPWIAAILIGCRFQLALGICYYVHPQGQEDLCPQNSDYICCTFSEYATNSSQYFTSNTTEFYFRGSKHQLNRSAVFSKLTDIKLWGDVNGTDSFVKIDCDGFGFKFDDIVKLLIANLEFLGARPCKLLPLILPKLLLPL